MILNGGNMNIINKLIHRDEIKLRILMTDCCNKNCSFCLNDFQIKPIDKPLFLDTNIAKDAIRTYVKIFSCKYPSVLACFDCCICLAWQLLALGMRMPALTSHLLAGRLFQPDFRFRNVRRPDLS